MRYKDKYLLNVQKLEKENAQLREQLRESEKFLKQFRDGFGEHENEISELEEQLAEAQSELVHKGKVAQSWFEKHEMCKRKLKEANDRIAELDGALEDMIQVGNDLVTDGTYGAEMLRQAIVTKERRAP